MAKKKIKPVKAVIALCEGKTDVAFLRRLLEADHYKDYIEIVSEMPHPFGLGRNEKRGSYFINKLRTYNYDSSRLRDRPILPIILRRTQGQSDTFLFLYDMNGMNRTENYRKIITDFNMLTAMSASAEIYVQAKMTKTHIALAFTYDLDKKTTTNRLQHIYDNYADLIPELKHLSESKQITNSKDYKSIGYYFLKKDNEQAGNLEDIILPLMKKDNKVVFQNAETFLNSNGEFIRYKETNPSEKDDNKTQSDLKKSLIGTVGQLEHSGLGNADIIKLTSMLNKGKFKTSVQCQAIIKFFHEMRKAL